MRICYLSALPPHPHTGPGSHIIGMLKALSALGHNITLVSPQAQIAKSFVPQLHTINLKDNNWPAKTASLNANLANHVGPHYDVIYQRSQAGLVLPSLMSSLKAVPFFLEINGMLIPERRMFGASQAKLAALSLTEGMALHAASKIITVSTQLKNFLIQRYNLRHRKLVHIPNGVDTSSYVPCQHKTRLKRQLGLSPQDYHIGFIGSLQPWRRLHESIKAMKLLQQDWFQIKLLVVGAGPLFDELKNLVAQYDLHQTVQLTGQLDRKLAMRYMQALDVALSFDNLPYDFGPASLKLRNYAACGIYQIGSNETSAGAFIREHKLGICCNAADPHEIAKALVQCMERRKKIARYKHRIRRFAEAQLDWHGSAKKLEGHLLQAIQERNQQR